MPSIFEDEELRHFINDWEQGYIAGAFRHGAKIAEICADLHLPWATVARHAKNPSQQHNNKEPNSRKGRPKKYDDRAIRHILRIVRSNPRIKYRELRKQSGLDLSHQTLRRILAEHNIGKWIEKERPALSEKHAASRLSWCLKREHWSVEQWGQVIWSDECSVQRGKPEVGRVFRTPQQK